MTFDVLFFIERHIVIYITFHPFFSQKGIVYCCIPVVESKDRPPLLQM